VQVVHLCRKPLSAANVAGNLMRHGCGAINIDDTRISYAGESDLAKAQEKNPGRDDLVTSNVYGAGRPQQRVNQTGRWPANLVLSHRVDCEHLGTARVASTSITNLDGIVRRGGSHADAKGHQTPGRVQPCFGYADEDGLEEVAVWDCVPGCPTGELDAEQGVKTSGSHRPYAQNSKGWKNTSAVNTHSSTGDAGMVSRYYKQAKEGEMQGVPEELSDYLHTMIAPTHLEDCQVLMVEDLSVYDWTQHEDASCHGLIANSPADGDPSPFLDEIWRVLKPGAHVMLISPEEEPTGHTGACACEDRGFEVRDAILWVREPGRLHYVPKPAQRERHAGCEHLKLRRREREEEEAGADTDANADDDLMDTSEVEAEDGHDLDERNLHKGNIHPTCKPKDLMARLLADVPQDALVIDPFMGSGTTGLACLETGHDFIGIEMEEDYIEIADARIRHHDRRNVGGGATLESEAPSANAPRQEMDLGDLFDL
jgi:hypothetical protein